MCVFKEDWVLFVSVHNLNMVCLICVCMCLFVCMCMCVLPHPLQQGANKA